MHVHAPPRMACFGLALVALAACGGTATPGAESPSTSTPPSTTDSDATAETGSSSSSTTTQRPTAIEVEDLSPGSDFDRGLGGERTRSMVAADFDNDGLDDMFVGNPGDPSFVVLNTSVPGSASFELLQVLSEGHLSWTAAAADFDNDGDVDLMVGGGGNECQELDQLWQNQLVETGSVSFVEVREAMGLTRSDFLDRMATTGVRWADFDNDGWLDLYVAHNASPRCGHMPPDTAQNQLWRNVGGERFENVTESSGMAAAPVGSTRHPSVFDYDDDGDLDIFDSNLQGKNVFLHNLHAETGELTFGSLDPVLLDGADQGPLRAFASCTADFDNDGFEDLLVLNRAASECSVAPDPDATGGYGLLHAVFRNTGAGSFENVTAAAGLDVQVAGDANGVMGCQVGDLNGDGAVDVFVGNGGPDAAGANDLYLGATSGIAFDDESALIRQQGAFRTHGSVIADIDGDWVPELVVGNGGPAVTDDVNEPNRILSFRWLHDASYLQVRLAGDGVHVNRDAIGAKVELVFEGSDGATRSLFRTVKGGSCFSADNGRALHFGLGHSAESQPDDIPVRIDVRWPDGTTSQHPVVSEPGASQGMAIAYPG